MLGKVIAWQCESAEHLAMRSRLGIGGITIHEGGWAYCDGLAGDAEHRWVATGGVPLESVVRWGHAVHSLNGTNGNGATKRRPAKTDTTGKRQPAQRGS
jgi:hypothetical protein